MITSVGVEKVRDKNIFSGRDGCDGRVLVPLELRGDFHSGCRLTEEAY